MENGTHMPHQGLAVLAKRQADNKTALPAWFLLYIEASMLEKFSQKRVFNNDPLIFYFFQQNDIFF
jgi:hypothetical protein